MGAIRPKIVSCVAAMSLGSACVDTGFAWAEEPEHPDGLLRITSATLGSNCGATAGNVTWPLVKACDGNERCSLRLLGDIGTASGGSCAKDLTVEYRCGNRARLFTSAVPETAEPGAELLLYCGRPPEPSELQTAALTLGDTSPSPTLAEAWDGEATEERLTLARASDCAGNRRWRSRETPWTLASGSMPQLRRFRVALPEAAERLDVRIEGVTDAGDDEGVALRVSTVRGDVLLDVRSAAAGWQAFEVPLDGPGELVIALRDLGTRASGSAGRLQLVAFGPAEERQMGSRSRAAPRLSAEAADALRDPSEELSDAVRREVGKAWLQMAEPMLREALDDPSAEISTEAWATGSGGRRYVDLRAWYVDPDGETEILVEVLHGAGPEAAAARFGESFEEIKIDEVEAVTAVDFPADRAVLDTIGGMGSEALYWLQGESYFEARKERPARPLAEALRAAAEKHGLDELFGPARAAGQAPSSTCSGRVKDPTRRSERDVALSDFLSGWETRGGVRRDRRAAALVAMR